MSYPSPHRLRITAAGHRFIAETQAGAPRGGFDRVAGARCCRRAVVNRVLPSCNEMRTCATVEPQRTYTLLADRIHRG